MRNQRGICVKTKTAWWLAVLLVPVLSSAQAPDKDGDGVPNEQDDCPYTSAGAQVDRTGCALDEDFDGVADGIDRCPASSLGASVDVDGCAKNQTAARQAKPTPVPPPAQPTPPPVITGVDPFSVRDAAVESPSVPEPEAVAVPEAVVPEPVVPAPEAVAVPEAVVPEPVVPAPEAVAVPEPVTTEPEPALPVVIFPEPAAIRPLPDEVRTSLNGGALLKVPKLRSPKPMPIVVAPAAPEAVATPATPSIPAAPELTVVTEPIFYGGRRVTVATMVPRAAVPLPAPAPAPVIAATGPWTLAIAKPSELSTANQLALNDIVGAVLNGKDRYEIAGPASQAALARSYLVAQGVPGERLRLNPSSGTAGPVEIRAAN